MINKISIFIAKLITSKMKRHTNCHFSCVLDTQKVTIGDNMYHGHQCFQMLSLNTIALLKIKIKHINVSRNLRKN